MKNFFYKPKLKQVFLILALAHLLACCADQFPSSYILNLPEPPSAWVSLLGAPHWRLEWINRDGQKQMVDYPPGSCGGIEIEIPITWTNPVTAWPYWPAHNLHPNTFKPCGALFPLDAKNGKLRLNWEAGVDTIFYWELAHANNQNDSKSPSYFDWSRFRELFESETLSEAVREDRWVVNWRTVAERTISSNFDRRRIVSEAAQLKHIPVPAGTWYGASPFAKPLVFTEREQPVFPVRPGLNVWISAKGILRVNGNTWVFSEIRNKE